MSLTHCPAISKSLFILCNSVRAFKLIQGVLAPLLYNLENVGQTLISRRTKPLSSQQLSNVRTAMETEVWLSDAVRRAPVAGYQVKFSLRRRRLIVRPEITTFLAEWSSLPSWRLAWNLCLKAESITKCSSLVEVTLGRPCLDLLRLLPVSLNRWRIRLTDDWFIPKRMAICLWNKPSPKNVTGLTVTSLCYYLYLSSKKLVLQKY